MAERASIFADDDLDLSGFAPVENPPRRAATKAAIRDVAEKRGFTSREPASPAPAPPAPASAPAPEIPRRRYTTGRNRQLNMKVTEGALRRFYALADAQGWVLGETFEHAVAALERELEQKR